MWERSGFACGGVIARWWRWVELLLRLLQTTTGHHDVLRRHLLLCMWGMLSSAVAPNAFLCAAAGLGGSFRSQVVRVKRDTIREAPAIPPDCCASRPRPSCSSAGTCPVGDRKHQGVRSVSTSITTRLLSCAPSDVVQMQVNPPRRTRVAWNRRRASRGPRESDASCPVAVACADAASRWHLIIRCCATTR